MVAEGLRHGVTSGAFFRTGGRGVEPLLTGDEIKRV